MTIRQICSSVIGVVRASNPEGINQYTHSSYPSVKFDAKTSKAAFDLTDKASKETKEAFEKGQKQGKGISSVGSVNVADAHKAAAEAHEYAAKKYKSEQFHSEAGKAHEHQASFHREQAKRFTAMSKIKASEARQVFFSDVIMAEDAGNCPVCGTPMQDGKCVTCDAANAKEDGLLSQSARQAFKEGKNPAPWVGDEATWEKAKTAADKTYDEGDDAYWPSVVTIYKNMGGTVKSREATGHTTMSDHHSKLHAAANKAIQEDPRWDTDKHGQPEGSPGDYEPYVVEVTSPDSDGSHHAIIQTDDGRLVKHKFDYDSDKDEATMADGDSEPTERTTVYSKAIADHDAAVKAANPEGVNQYSKGMGRGGENNNYADRKVSKPAFDLGEEAHKSGQSSKHFEAAAEHEKAESHYLSKMKEAIKEHGSQHESVSQLSRMRSEHSLQAMHHQVVGSKLAKAEKVIHQNTRASDTLSKDVVHCRDSGVLIAESAKWELDKPADLQWMPGGITTIEATYNNRPINLTVECGEDTASAVQASFDLWKSKYPKQKPFGCIEHREEEAALLPEKFEWRDDPEPGVYCTATPTELGARNVNGRIHRSWSPSFTTDAEYGKCKCADCGRKVSACECDGMLTFPDGAKGSKSNPAKITGVAFSVGSLTNKPAFKNILPVRAKEAGQGEQDPQPVKPKADTTKGLRMKIKFIKARGKYAAGETTELDHAEAWPHIEAGYALDTKTAEVVEAQEVENKRLRQGAKDQQLGVIKAKVADARKRYAIAPKDETVEAKAMEKLETSVDASGAYNSLVFALLCDQLDALPAKADLEKLAGRALPNKGDKGFSFDAINAQGVDIRDAGTAYVEARDNMDKAIKAGNFKEAFQLSLRSSGYIKRHFDPIIKAGGDFMLADVIKAADTPDPDTQVGTLATGLILQRNLGFLKNKLAWLPYLSTDMRNEPALFGQPVFTRYITPPNVLTFVPGVGYTSDASTISTASAGTVQDAETQQTSGTRTPSAPSTTDVTVKLDQHKAVEIEFSTQKLALTARNLFAEQQGAQFYSLAEVINKFVLAKLFAATWTGVINTYSKSLATWDIKGLVGVKNALSIDKVPDVGRFLLLHSVYHDKLLEDSNLVLANTILAAFNKESEAIFQTGELPPIFGVKPLESQLSSAVSGVVTAITDPSNFGTVNQVGFAGNMSSMVFVARVPQDYTKIFADIPATASIQIITEPDSGLSMMFTKYVNNTLASVSARCALMYGAAQGDPRIGIIIKPS